MKVLHVLANSPPDVNGYAVRTQKILSNQIPNCIGLTSPWYPERESMVDDYQIDNVTYLRTIHPVWKSENKFSHKLVKSLTRMNKNKLKKNTEASPSKKSLCCLKY